MYKRLTLLFITLIVGCSTVTYKRPPVNAPADDATIKLAEAADSISHSMLEVARVEKVIQPRRPTNRITIPSTANLQTRASVSWSGPIEELVNQIARSAQYRLRVLGKTPSVPVLVSIQVEDESLAEILRDIDYQAGKKAAIQVYPDNQVIELRYARIYS